MWCMLDSVKQQSGGGGGGGGGDTVKSKAANLPVIQSQTKTSAGRDRDQSGCQGATNST